MEAALDAPIALPSAEIGRRFAAGLIDLVVMGLLGALFLLGPLLYSGGALPMVGAFAAITAYAIAPAAAFGATPGMALMGLRIVGANGEPADATEIAFRELIGRGLIGVAYFGTAAVGLFGYLTGYLQFFVPTGLGLLFFVLSAMLLAFSAVSHLMALMRTDQRALHDLMARTQIVPARAAAVELDEDAAEFARNRKKSKLRGFVVTELLLFGLALGLPVIISKPMDGPADLEARVALAKAEKRFEKDATDPEAAGELAAVLRRENRPEAAEAILAEHRAALVAAGIKPSDRDYQVQKYRALLKGTPCALGSMVALGDRLNELGDYQGALDEIDRFRGGCEDQPRLSWVAVHAHRELGQFDKAIADSSLLIDSEPDDSDFWWWRGEDRGKAGDKLGAEADYRQSMSAYADQFATKRFAALMKEGDRCEGIRALQHLLDETPDAAGDWVGRELEALTLGAECEATDGQGRAVLSIGKDGSVRTPGKIDGRTGKFMVHSTGYVTVTRAFAEKAGLVGGDREVEIRVASEVVRARLAIAKEVGVAKSRAAMVPIAIVETLPGEIDGLIGLSYLWRFSLERTDRAFILSER